MKHYKIGIMVKTSSKYPKIHISTQPDNTSCGPTCLHALYRYWDDPIELEDVIREVGQFDQGGGTLAVILACHALERGYQVSLYSYNLNIFDPCWELLDRESVIIKLKKQLEVKPFNEKFKMATQSYIKFLELGGELYFDELSADLLKELHKDKNPILSGLSATYLYKTPRENPLTNDYDDVLGEPAGHFVVVYGLDESRNKALIADPYKLNPVANQNYYSIPIERLINAVLLGVVTYDGNLLCIKPASHKAEDS